MWIPGVSNPLPKVLGSGRHVADAVDGTDANSEVTPLKGNAGLAQWRTLPQYSHVVACRRPTALRLDSVNMAGDPFAMGISSRK